MYSVIFVEPETAGNVGSIARAMSNFGMKELILVNPKCNVRSDECKATAKHAYWIIENSRSVTSLEKVANDFISVIGTTGKNNKKARDVRELKKSIIGTEGKKAIVIGRESTGLNEKELTLCTALANIPTNKEYPILNASHAAAIMFYELSPQQGPMRSIEKSETDAMLRYFDQATEEADLRDKNSLKRAFRDIIGRSLPSKQETHILTGFFKAISGKK